jgi:hypothetical protein
MRFKIVLLQIVQDLIGKDAYRGITLSYAWLANQFGHFALGFIPAAIYYARHDNKKSGDIGIYGPSLIVWGAWFLFESANYLVSIVRLTKGSLDERNAKKYFYRPRKLHFYYDLLTDMCFFGVGAFFAIFLFDPRMVYLWYCLPILVFLLFAFRYWYRAKIYLQRALFPFQYRLSQWVKFISPENKDKINRFMQEENTGTHLLVLGEDDDDKIHLCVGIGTEISYKHKKCRYLTAIKAFECFYRFYAPDSPTSHHFSWNWQEADLLIIDDINPSHFDIHDVISPHEFLGKIDDNFGAENRQLLKSKKVIWILGNETLEKKELEIWKEMIMELGVDSNDLIAINLSDHLKNENRKATVKYDYRKQNLPGE